MSNRTGNPRKTAKLVDRAGFAGPLKNKDNPCLTAPKIATRICDAPPKMANLSPWVYFIQSGDGGPVKIGSARCVKTRIGQLQTGNPVPLIFLLALPGSDVQEREWQDKFAHLSIQGEWFRHEGELAEFLDANKQGNPYQHAPQPMGLYRRMKAKYPDLVANGASRFQLLIMERRLEGPPAKRPRLSPESER